MAVRSRLWQTGVSRYTQNSGHWDGSDGSHAYVAKHFRQHTTAFVVGSRLRGCKAERISLGTENEILPRSVELESERRRSMARQGRTNPRSANDILERRCRAAEKR